VDHHRPPKLGIQCEVISSKRRLHNQGPIYMSITFLIVRFAITIVERERERENGLQSYKFVGNQIHLQCSQGPLGHKIV